MKRSALRMLAAASVVAFAGCAVPPPPDGEDLRSQALPATHVPEQWSQGAAWKGDVVDGWLALFADPELDKLVAEAMAYNADLRAAGAALLPQVNIAGRGGGKMSGDNSGLQGIGLFANWELDLWGRVRAVRATGTAQYEAAALDARYARESIAALVAKSWFVAREAARQRAIAAEMVTASEALSGLARDRLQVGKGDEFDVSQAEATTFSYRDLVLQADLARQNALRAIEILAGRYPSASIDPGSELPALPGAVPVGLPSQLLERRPDVRAAERRVAAAFYRVHEAQAARLPRIALTASVSSVSSELFVLKERDNPIWSVGANFMMPIFTGGALQAQVEIRTAEQKVAVAEYARIGSRAFGEVEGALSAAFNLDGRVAVLERSVVANERSVGYARVRYDVGSGDLRGIQQQMLAYHATRSSLVHVQAERLVQRVNLHLALGGGFESPPK